MKIEHLSGLIAAPFTPMNVDGSLNLGIISNYYNLLKSNGVTGAFICGSTGEGTSLTIKEKKRVAEAWADCTRSDASFKVITLVGGTCLQDAIDLSQHAREIGLHSVALTAPSYFKPANIDVLADICIAVAASVPDVLFYYYHIPVLTGVNFPMIELLKKLDGKLANFAGIKYTHEDFMDFLACINFKDRKYNMLWGRDECLLSALVLGAQGGVGSTFNYAAPLYLNLIDAYERGDHDEARARQQQSIDMIALLGKYGGIATGKAFMKLLGLDCGGFRLPVTNMTSSQYALFEKDVTQINFKSFCSRIPSVVNGREK